jgi:hypothetical protein
VPVIPLARLPVVIESAGAATVRLRERVVDAFAESVTRAVKLVVPAAVGVPAMAPDELSERPEGRLPLATAQV